MNRQLRNIVRIGYRRPPRRPSRLRMLGEANTYSKTTLLDSRPSGDLAAVTAAEANAGRDITALSIVPPVSVRVGEVININGTRHSIARLEPPHVGGPQEWLLEAEAEGERA